MNKWKTQYNKDWENETLFPEFSKWVKNISNKPNCDRCKFCPGSVIDLSNMAIQAIKSHSKSKKHEKASTLFTSNSPITFFQRKLTEVESETKNLDSSNSSNSLHSSNSSNSSSNSSNSSGQSVSFQSVIDSNSMRNARKAEVLWAIKVIVGHHSYRSCGDLSELFVKMFPDSNTAREFSMGRTKLSYVICHGLAPYYQNKLVKYLTPISGIQPNFVVLFDEAYNSVSNTKQLDVHVSYFDKKEKIVCRSYYDSQFLGHATAQDQLSSFKNIFKNVDYATHLIQVSMDRPNVNCAFLDLLQENIKTANPEAPTLLQLGSCGLHVIHEAYKTGQESTDWKFAKILSAFYSIFKKSPARRSDYLQINELHESHEGKDTNYMFPLKYCGHRWLENGKVVSRLMEKLQLVHKYIDSFKKLPKNDERFTVVKEACHNPVFKAILQFSLCIANDLEPFLKLFQSERPLAFFLYEKVKQMMIALMNRFFKRDVLASANSAYKILKLDLKNESNLLSTSSVKIGFGASTELKKLKTVHHTNIRDFQSNARKLLINVIDKMREQSPLAFKLTLYPSALSPTQIVSMSNIKLEKHFASLMGLLIESKWINSVTADKALDQYVKLIKNKDFVAEMKKFDIASDRVDSLYAGLLSEALHYIDLW